MSLHLHVDHVSVPKSWNEISGHVCGLFRDVDEQALSLQSYVKDGFERGERACHIIDPERRDRHFQSMRDVGIDVDEATASGQLIVFDWKQIYFDTGLSDDMEIVQAFNQLREDGRARGFPRTRFFNECGYKKQTIGHLDMIAQEARFQKFGFHSPEVTDISICSYLIPEWSSSVFMDLLRTHQFVILRGHLHDNPFFERPDEVLASLAEEAACC